MVRDLRDARTPAGADEVAAFETDVLAHVRHGKGARGCGPRERMVPLINNAGATLRWFVEDVWAQFGDDHTRPGVPLLPSERKNADGSATHIEDAWIAGQQRAAERMKGLRR